MPKILENVKDDILNIAKEMILIDGTYNISIRELASRCGVSIGTIYNNFSSKQEIIVSITKSEWEILMKKIDTSNKNNSDHMKKLKFIFDEVKIFLNIVHNIHNENFIDALEVSRIMKIEKNKQDLHEQLSKKIYDAICDLEFPKENILTCSIISKLFFSYAIYPAISFNDLSLYIEKLIN